MKAPRCVSCRGVGLVLARNYTLAGCPHCKGSKVETRPEVLARLDPVPMSKRALRRHRRKLRGEVNKANAKALMMDAMYYAKLREMTAILNECDYWKRKYEAEVARRQSMCSGLIVVPR